MIGCSDHRQVPGVLSFEPSPKIVKQLRTLQGKLAERCKELETAARGEREYLNKCALISNVGATTRIENAVLTDVEVEWVDTELSKDGKPTAFDDKKAYILDKLSRERERSIEEVVGSRNVLTKIYLQAEEFKPLTQSIVRGLHRELLRFYPPAQHYLGKYKTVLNRVVATDNNSGETRIVLEPAEPGVMTEMAMQELVDWYNRTSADQIWPLLTAVEFTFRFLAIHPFQDGNGRLGRALFLLVLLQSDDSYLQAVTPCLAIDRHIERNKEQYYSILQQCSGSRYLSDPSQYRYDIIVPFFLKVFEAALDDIEVYRTRFNNLKDLPESAVKVLDCFKADPKERLKVAEIEQATGLPRRTVQFALRTLTGKEFLQRLGRGAGTRYQLVF